MKRRSKMIGCSLAVAALGLSLAACSSSSSPSSSGGGTSSGAAASVRTIKLGFPNDLTGGNAFAGIEQRDMAQLAVKDFNAANKSVQLTLDVQDSKSTTAGA